VSDRRHSEPRHAAPQLIADPGLASGGRWPSIIKGPTACGKTRFVEHGARRTRRPLVTVACHEDLSAEDLTGRRLPDGDATRRQDGPLTQAARFGAIRRGPKWGKITVAPYRNGAAG
jgi:hypothetical protein